MAQKEASAAAVGGNSIIALDGTESNSIIGRQYSDHPQYQDLVVALKSRSYGGNLTAKKEVLLKFRPSELDTTAVERYWRDPDLYKHYFRHLLDDLHRNTLNQSQIKKNLTMVFVSEMIADLYVLYQWNKELPDERRPSRSKNDPSIMVKKAFASLSELVDTVLVAYSDDRKKNEKKKGGRAKVNLQVTGIRVQDTLPFEVELCDSEACPNPQCKHYYCRPVNTPEEVKAQQKVIDDKFDRKMAEWVASSVGGKPRRQKSVAMKLACYCCKVNCLLRLDGGNCPACRAAATAGESMVSIGGDGKAQCQCEICNCSCQVLFGIHDRRKIAFEMEQKNWFGTSSSSSEPTNTPSYFNKVIQETLQQSAIEAAQEPVHDPTLVHQNALSLATDGILHNPTLQSVRLRSEMQKQLPCTTMTTTNGLSMKQLRKREKAGLVTPSAEGAVPVRIICVTPSCNERPGV